MCPLRSDSAPQDPARHGKATQTAIQSFRDSLGFRSAGLSDPPGRRAGSRAPVRQVANGDQAIKLRIKVVPASSRDCIAGWLGETLKVRVRAAAERGKANVAVERLVAEALGIPAKCARIVTGRTSARKLIEISGLSEAELRQRLAKLAT